MNKHIRCRKTIDKLVVLDAIDMTLLSFLLFRLSMTISKRLRHGTNKERTTAAGHEVRNVVPV